MRKKKRRKKKRPKGREMIRDEAGVFIGYVEKTEAEKDQVFIIENVETGLIDGYYRCNRLALEAAVRFGIRSGQSMEVKLIPMSEDRKLPYLPDEVMMKYEIWKQEAEEEVND